MSKETIHSIRQRIEKLMPPIVTETLDQFIAISSVLPLEHIEANILHRPINIRIKRAGPMAGPYIWDEEYVTIYTSHRPTGRRIEYIEQYQNAAIIPYEERKNPNIEKQKETLKHRCIITAKHRFLRFHAQGLSAKVSLMEEGNPLTRERLDEVEQVQKSQRLQPFIKI